MPESPAHLEFIRQVLLQIFIFAVYDENGLPRVYRRFGDALVLSITLVPGKAYTAAVTQCKSLRILNVIMRYSNEKFVMVVIYLSKLF